MSLISYYLYTHQISLIYVMWDYLLMFLCASDVATCGEFDRAIQIAIVHHHFSDTLLLGDDNMLIRHDNT